MPTITGTCLGLNARLMGVWPAWIFHLVSTSAEHLHRWAAASRLLLFTHAASASAASAAGSAASMHCLSTDFSVANSHKYESV